MFYLYIKTHNVTKLKYLGQTKRDPFKYKGSGKRWNNHLNKHGYDVSTEIILQTEDKKELKRKGLYFSQKFNVVESAEWANICEEQGQGGYTSYTTESKKKLSIANKGKNNGMYGKPSWNKGMKLGPLSKEIREQISQKLKGRPSPTRGKTPWNKNKPHKLTEVKCAYCDTWSTPGAIATWHNDNCKLNPYKIQEEKITCPHCGKKGSPRGGFRRWHFDNCRFKI